MWETLRDLAGLAGLAALATVMIFGIGVALLLIGHGINHLR